MTDFDLIHMHAMQDITLFRWVRVGDFQNGIGVPGQNVLFWVHPYADHESYVSEKYTVKVWLRVPSTNFFGKLFKKSKWVGITLNQIEQHRLHPRIWAIKSRLDALRQQANADARMKLVKGALGMQEADLKMIQQKVEEQFGEH